MHKEIFTENQLKLFPLVKAFKREFYLVGGTAIALYLGHRRSIDFDLFKSSSLHQKRIISKISASHFKYKVTRRVTEQLNVTINDVSFTFFEYPYVIDAKNNFEDVMRLPSLIDLAAMKAYALGRRSKWKDYVDFYFLLKNNFTINQISDRAVEIYDQMFSQKLFRAQLSFFKDINYDEPVECLEEAPSRTEIQRFLIDRAIDIGI
ncbi:MAG: nucleotidyl transferase AbiEii/AbiGii toxin family protein [Bacteroidales bacterium]|nr:nucleotidyl transferase AbiEii/AbiGii toxin family protein [Bacteroidales bacterium]